MPPMRTGPPPGREKHFRPPTPQTLILSARHLCHDISVRFESEPDVVPFPLFLNPARSFGLDAVMRDSSILSPSERNLSFLS